MSGRSFSYRTASHAQLVLTELATATIAISQYKYHAMTSEQCPAWSVCKQRPARRSFEFWLCLEEYVHVVGPYVGVHHGRVCETNALLATTRSKPKTEKDHTYISIYISYIYLNKYIYIYYNDLQIPLVTLAIWGSIKEAILHTDDVFTKS